eukprot:TRINITY_DN67439_c0_g1_i1.p1 TRINITY_DN67439_c0_g1~~TRINITY_DN67439_c0_g1_i1.p1  ORF type:complete len:692 (-),score=87.12 TRINITY_DN67439_c0_g1_i1:71-2146(-)
MVCPNPKCGKTPEEDAVFCHCGKYLLESQPRQQMRKRPRSKNSDSDEPPRKRHYRYRGFDLSKLPDLPTTPMDAFVENMSIDPVKQQALRFKFEPWRSVASGDVGIMTHAAKDANIFRQRGPVGDTPLHVMMLLEQWDLARAVASKYPLLIKDQYLGSEYMGENCIHLATVKGNAEMVHYLLELCQEHGILKEVLKQKAVGKFFKPGRPCYFGETPLGFAASTNNMEIVKDMVLNFGADIEQKDSRGNTIMHMIVKHKLTDMVDPVVCLWHELHADDLRKLPCSLLTSRNKNRLTPLCLAAKIGCKDMFNCLLTRKVETAWRFGPVTCIWLPLEDFDKTPCGRMSAVEHIIHEGHFDLLTLPYVHALLISKWEKFGRRVFLTRCAWALLNAIVFSCMVVFRPADDVNPVRRLLELRHRDIRTNCVDECFWNMVKLLFFVLCKAFTLLIGTAKLWTELLEILSEGILDYFGHSGAGQFENVVSLTYCLSMLVSELLPHTNQYKRGLLSLASLLAWVYLLWFLLAFKATGHLVIMVWRIVLHDYVRFLLLTSVFLTGFSLSFLALEDSSKRGPHAFAAFLCKSFETMLNGMEHDNNDSTLLRAYLLFYTAIVSVLLVNMFIAMMSGTYQLVQDQAEKEWFLERARVCMSLEQELRSKGQSEHPDNMYWLEDPQGRKIFQMQQTVGWDRDIKLA